MDDIYKDITEYNLNKKREILVFFDDMIADMPSNEKLNPVVNELFIRGRKVNISLVFIAQSCFAVPKNVKLNSTHYFIMKIASKQDISFGHSSDIDFKDFMNLYKKMYCKTKFFSSY